MLTLTLLDCQALNWQKRGRGGRAVWVHNCSRSGIQNFAWNAVAEMQTTASQAAFEVMTLFSIFLAQMVDVLIHRCLDLVRRLHRRLLLR